MIGGDAAVCVCLLRDLIERQLREHQLILHGSGGAADTNAHGALPALSPAHMMISSQQQQQQPCWMHGLGSGGGDGDGMMLPILPLVTPTTAAAAETLSMLGGRGSSRGDAAYAPGSASHLPALPVLQMCGGRPEVTLSTAAAPPRPTASASHIWDGLESMTSPRPPHVNRLLAQAHEASESCVRHVGWLALPVRTLSGSSSLSFSWWCWAVGRSPCGSGELVAS